MPVNNLLVTRAVQWLQDNCKIGELRNSHDLAAALGITDEENDLRSLMLQLHQRGIVRHFDDSDGAGSFKRL